MLRLNHNASLASSYRSLPVKVKIPGSFLKRNAGFVTWKMKGGCEEMNWASPQSGPGHFQASLALRFCGSQELKPAVSPDAKRVVHQNSAWVLKSVVVVIVAI
jgi:hypothetical protein